MQIVTFDKVIVILNRCFVILYDKIDILNRSIDVKGVPFRLFIVLGISSTDCFVPRNDA